MSHTTHTAHKYESRGEGGRGGGASRVTILGEFWFEFVTNYITRTMSRRESDSKRLTRSLFLSLSFLYPPRPATKDLRSFRKVVSLDEKANEPGEEAIGKIAASFSCRARRTL